MNVVYLTPFLVIAPEKTVNIPHTNINYTEIPELCFDFCSYGKGWAHDDKNGNFEELSSYAHRKLPELKPCIGRFHTAKLLRVLMEMIFLGAPSSMALNGWLLVTSCKPTSHTESRGKECIVVGWDKGKTLTGRIKA